MADTLTIEAANIVARLAAGDLKSVTPAEVRTLLNVADGADVTADNAPQAHSTSHTDGSDDIQDATAAQKGLATAAQITKLDGIESGATGDQTDAEIRAAVDPQTIDVRDSGVTLDGSTDDTTNFQAAIDLASAGDTIFAPAGTIKITTTITVPIHVNLDFNCKILYSGAATTNIPALVIGDATTGAANGSVSGWRPRLMGLHVARETQSNWDIANTEDIGIKIVRASNAIIQVLQARGFHKGVQCLGITGGFVFNHISLGNISNNKIGIDLRTGLLTTAGWVNSNYFYGGNFQNDSGVGTGISRYAFAFSNDESTDPGQTNIQNANTFRNFAAEINSTVAESGNPKVVDGGADIAAWAATTAYTAGDYKTSNGSIWEALSTDTSGSTAPKDPFNQSESDGTINWKWVDFTQKAISCLMQFGQENLFDAFRNEGNSTEVAAEGSQSYSNSYSIITNDSGFPLAANVGADFLIAPYRFGQVKFFVEPDSNVAVKSWWHSGNLPSKYVARVDTTNIQVNVEGVHLHHKDNDNGTRDDFRESLINTDRISLAAAKAYLPNYACFYDSCPGILVEATNKRFVVRKETDSTNRGQFAVQCFDGNPLIDGTLIDGATASPADVISTVNGQTFTWTTDGSSGHGGFWAMGGSINDGGFVVSDQTKFIHFFVALSGVSVCMKSFSIGTTDHFPLNAFPGHGIATGNYLDEIPDVGYLQSGQVIHRESTVAGENESWQVTTTGFGSARDWEASTAYIVDEIVNNDSTNTYICTTAGTSAGSGGPTGTGTGISDNTVVWDFYDNNPVLANGPEQAATGDQTGAEIKTLYEAEANAFTDAQFTKLAGIETGATADQSDAEIKTAYENNADTNAFTNADETKLDGIEAAADVTDETNVKAALDGATVTAATATTSDKILIQDADDSDNLKQDTAGDILKLKPESIIIAASDESTTDLAVGTGVVTFRMPYAFTLSEVRASVQTAPTGSVLTVDINESGTTILSTKITIDATEKTSTTAVTAPVISDSALADDAEITIDIDGVGSTVPGKGLKVYLIGTQT